jgi:tetratricopeptide (TPR) repeat protein
MRNYSVSLVVVALASSTALAQQQLKTPQPSPAAAVSQEAGLTNIEVRYHRPAVNGRKVWGELVPFGEVWRAGANENTVVTFSSPVKVGGKTLAAGSYGLHMIPTANDWTVIFNKVTTAWGSFSYDKKEDALRVTVKPRALPEHEERLEYAIEDVSDKGATLTLKWEKLAVPVRIDVDTPAVTMASMRGELLGLSQFFWQPWVQAAGYWVQNGGSLDEAQKFADKAMTMNENFQTLRAAARVAEKKGDKKKAEALQQKSMAMATEQDLNVFGYTLLGQKKTDEAIAIFERNVKEHPQSWNVYDSLAEALMTKGDKAGAVEYYGKALTMVKDEPNKKRITATLTRLKQ